MILLIIILLKIISLVLGNNISNNEKCDVYIAPSLINNGTNGIFAGRNYLINETIEYLPTILISKELCNSWSLNSYIYSYNDNYNILIFGSLLNYIKLIEYTNSYLFQEIQSANCILCNDQLNSYYSITRYGTTRQIHEGEELFISELSLLQSNYYSTNKSNDSFIPKGYSYNIEYLTNNGFCISDTYVKQSTIPNAGRGLFANRLFKKNEVVTISPVLFLSIDQIRRSLNYSPILNYCIGSLSVSDIAVLLLGKGALINHQSPSVANVKMIWYKFNSNNDGETSSVLSNNPKDLINSNVSLIDIAFIAVRDIKYNEEISMNYGEEWINSWASYLINLIGLRNNKIPFSLESLTFRQPIQPSNDFFPKHWK